MAVRTELYEAEDDALVAIYDDGPNCYGATLVVLEAYGSGRIELTLSKSLLLGLANEIKRQFNKQGYRAKGRHNNDGSSLTVTTLKENKQ